jgi:hypothetical protein
VKHSYWTGVRFWATTNAAYSVANAAWNGSVAATRLQSDTYVRSVWWGYCSYGSDATLAVPAWWAAANVYFVAEVDTTGAATKTTNLNSAEPKNRVAMAGMMPRRWSQPEFTPEYTVTWEMPQDGVITGTSRRKGDGVNYPRVMYGIHAGDQNGAFAGAAEAGYIIRAAIYGRVLWESDVP